MKDYQYKILDRKNNDEGIVRIEALRGPKDPFVKRSELVELLQPIYKKLDISLPGKYKK
jgi:hypothetical protein